MVPPEYPHERPPVCPGYLVGLPRVLEAARAESWRHDGALGQFYDGPITDVARTAIDLIGFERKSCEQHFIRKRSEGGA